MKLCIIGPSKRKKSDIKILNDAKKIFDSVLYVPYTNISLNLNKGRKVTYKGSELSKFDIILPRIPKNRSLFAYLLFNILDQYTPIHGQSFIITSDRFLMMDVLKRENIDIPQMYLVDSVSTALNLISKDKITFPISMRIPQTKKGIMFASSKKEAKSMLDALKSFKKPVYIEEFFKHKYYQTYIIGNEVAACIRRKPNETRDILFGKGKPKKVGLSTGMETLAIETASAVKTEFAMVELVKKPRKAVINVNLNPPLIKANKLTNKKIHKELLDYIKERGALTQKGKISLLDMFLRSAKIRVKDIFE